MLRYPFVESSTEQCFFWVLGSYIHNLGYLRSVYASLRRVGGSLCGWNVKKAPTQAPTQVFDRTWRSKPLAGQPLQTCLRLHCTAKHTWSAYATYHTVTFVLDFMISKINDAQLTIVILVQEVSVSVHACTTINHLQPLTRTKLCTCGVVGRHVACTLQISQSHMSHSTTSMRHTQSPVRVQTHDTVTSKLKSTMCPYITCLSVLCAIDTYTLLCIYRIHKKLRTGSLDFELKYK